MSRRMGKNLVDVGRNVVEIKEFSSRLPIVVNDVI